MYTIVDQASYALNETGIRLGRKMRKLKIKLARIGDSIAKAQEKRANEYLKSQGYNIQKMIEDNSSK